MNTQIQNLNWRYATKIFNPSKKINDEDLKTLIETLRLSPSSYGIQPWKFLIINNPETRVKLTEASYGQTQVSDASHLIVLCAKTDLTEGDVDKFIGAVAKTRNVSVESLAPYKEVLLRPVNSMTAEQKEVWNKKQVYLAMGFLMSAAAQMQIDTCPMEGFDPAKVDEILGLKQNGLTATLLCPMGYRADDDRYAESAKVRFDNEVVVEVRN